MSNPNAHHLTDAQTSELGREIDAMRDEIMDSRGDRDRAYILRMIRIQRGMALSARVLMLASILCLPVWPHALANAAMFWGLLALGTFMLGSAKILENMEIGHNVLHGQWDWMNDPDIQSNTWEWDHCCPSDQWMHTHNVIHHTWTNVMGKDRDVGYGMLRVTGQQRWHPFYLIQPLNVFLMATLFEWFIALHDLEINRLLAGKRKWTQAKPLWDSMVQKVWRQTLKDAVMWPALGVALTAPFAFFGLGPALWQVFVILLVAGIVANIIRNLWTFAIIFCGHFPAGVHHFSKESVEGETRGHWYVRQIMGSCNIRGGRLFNIMSGNLSHQIEHHLFPDMPSNRYPEIAPRVRAMADRYGLPYNSGRFSRQFGTTLWKLLRLSFPGPRKPRLKPVSS